MALFFPEGISGNVLYLPIMTYATMDLQLQPYIRSIVSNLMISDLDYSVWCYSYYTRKTEFIEGSLRIPFDDNTKVVSFSINGIDYYVFCVTDNLLKYRIQNMLDYIYNFSKSEEQYREKS